MRVVYVYADTPAEWNCSEWRCKAFSDAFNRTDTGVQAKLIHVSGFEEFLSAPVQAWVGPADLVIFQRNAVSPRALDAIQYWQGLGKPVALDLDDAYHILPWSNPAHEYWHVRQGGEALAWLERALWVADALIAPNPLLLQDWAHVCRGVLVPNFARAEWWTTIPSRAEAKEQLGLSTRIVIGWGGSVSHYDAWWGSGIREAAAAIAFRHPEVIWLIVGNDPRIVDALEVPASQKMGLRGVPPEDWPKVVAAFDIGVAPLFGPYDQRRSWIKGIEYALGGVPWVATDGVPYRLLGEGEGYLIQNSPSQWVGALEEILSRLSEEQERAASRIAQARRRFLVESNIDRVKEAYEQIIRWKRARGRLPGIWYCHWYPEPGRDPERSPAIVSNPFREAPLVSGYSHCLGGSL